MKGPIPPDPTPEEYRARLRASKPLEGGLRVRGGFRPRDPGRPLVSVVTTVWNGAKTLEGTIRSVLSQTYPNVEYIIVDGGSTDGTLDIVRKYEDRIAYWISEKDEGIFDGMNKGVALAAGDWVHILNGDDRYHGSGALEEALGSASPDAANFFSLVLEDEAGRQRTHRAGFAPWKMYVWAAVLHPALIVTRAQYERLGLFNPAFRDGADHDFMMRLFKAWPARQGDTVLTVMPQTGNSARNLWRATKDFMEITVRHGFPRALAWPVAAGKYLLWRTPAPLRRALRRCLSPASAYRGRPGPAR